MPPQDAGSSSLPPEVASLGRAEQVFANSPAGEAAVRMLGLAVGVLCIAGPIVGVALFYQLAPAADRARPPVLLTVYGLAAFFLILGVYLVYAVNRETWRPIFAFYPEHLAAVLEGQWVVIRWDEVSEYRHGGRFSLYPRLVLRDGRTLLLRNHFILPNSFYNAVRQRVERSGMPQPQPSYGGTAAAAPPGSIARSLAGPASPAAPLARWPEPVLRGGPGPSSPPDRRSQWVRRPLGAAVTGVCLIAIGLGILAWNGRWVKSVIAGPVPMTIAELRAVQDPAKLPNPWVSIAFTHALETNVGIESTRRGVTTPRSRYLLVQVQDRWLIAEVPHNYRGNKLEGYLDDWWTPLSRKVIDTIKGRFPDKAPQMLPYQINAEYSYRGQCLAMIGIILMLVVGGLFMAAPWVLQQIGGRRG
jgi:hypothetical protein